MNLLIIVGLLLFLLGVWVYERLPRWRAADARSLRERLTEEQFGERFFPPDLSPIAARSRRIASEQLGKDLSQLHPDDRLAEVFIETFGSLDNVNMFMAIEEEFGIELDDATLTSINTFRDIVIAVAAQRPFLAKWRRKLGRAIEERFGVSLTRDTLATIATPKAATDAIAAALRAQHGAPEICQNQRAFYLLRSALMRTTQAPRNSITPATLLGPLIHGRTARTVWPQLRDSVAARQWPPLVRPGWVNWLVCGVPFLGGVAFFAGLPALADWASLRGNSLGFALNIVSELRGFIVVPLVIFSWVLLVRGARRMSTALPSGIRTVGDLLPFVVTSAEMTWTWNEIEQLVRQIVETHLPLPPERYRLEGRFVEDFGMEAELETLPSASALR